MVSALGSYWIATQFSIDGSLVNSSIGLVRAKSKKEANSKLKSYFEKRGLKVSNLAVEPISEEEAFELAGDVNAEYGYEKLKSRSLQRGEPAVDHPGVLESPGYKSPEDFFNLSR